VIKDAREEKKRLTSNVHCRKYEVKKLKMTVKERDVRESREVVLPVEQGGNLSPESEDRIDPFVLSELREETGSATASADAAMAAASDAKSAIVEDVSGVVDSEPMTKDVQCIKYEMKKLKSREVSEVVSSGDPTILQEF
jgi:hypothetical protein